MLREVPHTLFVQEIAQKDHKNRPVVLFEFIWVNVFKKAVAQTCSVKKAVLEISQNSQENTCTTVSFLIE